jgi:hypothetical protein
MEIFSMRLNFHALKNFSPPRGACGIMSNITSLTAATAHGFGASTRMVSRIKSTWKR